MSHDQIGLLGIAAFFVLMGIGVQIGVAMGIVGLVGLVVLLGVSPATSTVAAGTFYFVIDPSWLVLPPFVLMGLIAAEAQLTDKTFQGLRRVTSGLPGGTALATVAGQAIFGGVSGTSIVDAMVFGKIASPTMRRLGYEKRFSYGLACAGGLLAVLIPPSNFVVVYALITQESVGRLLFAGLGPGIVLGFLYVGAVVVIALRRPDIIPHERESHGLVARITGLSMAWEMLLTFGILVLGLYIGVFTVEESAAWAALVLLIIGVVRGKLGWHQVQNVLIETIKIMGMLFLLIFAAKVFSKFIVVSGLGQDVVQLILNMHLSPIMFLVALVVLYSILGCFMESLSIVFITVPLVYPTVQALGIDPLWFYAVVVVSVELGLLTPPIAMNVFSTASVAEPDVTVEDVQLGTLPFVAAGLALVGLIIVFPTIAVWLPTHMLPLAR